ncbi:UNVERIFIED_CONTAM: hypothetical protein FKN15_055907 [Acipenser sinensis]
MTLEEENELDDDSPSCKRWIKKELRENEELSQTLRRVVERNSGSFYAEGQHVASSGGVPGQRNTNIRCEVNDWKPKLDQIHSLTNDPSTVGFLSRKCDSNFNGSQVEANGKVVCHEYKACCGFKAVF